MQSRSRDRPGWGGLAIGTSGDSSAACHKVDVGRVVTLETEGDQQVVRNPHAPMPLKVVIKGAKAEAGDVHLGRIGGDVQSPQDVGDSVEMLGREIVAWN